MCHNKAKNKHLIVKINFLKYIYISEVQRVIEVNLLTPAYLNWPGDSRVPVHYEPQTDIIA